MLDCHNLSKRFGGITSLRDVTLSFSSPEVTAIIGPNGAGKSTLLNTWTGFVRADSGETRVFGRVATGFSPQAIARLGVGRTFQDARVITSLTAWENVAVAQSLSFGKNIFTALRRFELRKREKVVKESARHWLEYVGLSQHEAAVAETLSYGQRKLLALTCAVATGAKVLLLDEPMAGLHHTARDHLRDLVGRLREDGKLVVFVEHDIAFVQAAAERLIVMEGGKIVDQGDPAGILKTSRVLAAFLGAAGSTDS